MSDVHFERTASWSEYMRSYSYTYTRKNAIRRYSFIYFCCNMQSIVGTFLTANSWHVNDMEIEISVMRWRMYRKDMYRRTRETTEGNQRRAKCATHLRKWSSSFFFLFFTISRRLWLTETEIVSPHATERMGTRIAQCQDSDMEERKGGEIGGKRESVPFPILHARTRNVKLAVSFQPPRSRPSTRLSSHATLERVKPRT